MKLVIDIDEKTYNEIMDDAKNTPRKLSHYERIIAKGTPLDEIRAEIAEYKDDKIIHAERNEMIDITLDIIDKYKGESEDQEC